MSGFQCPFCSMVMSANAGTQKILYFSFEEEFQRNFFPSATLPASTIEIIFYKCPNCNEYSIFTVGVGSSVKDTDVQIRPRSSAKVFPKYIPQNIRQDYEEACAIIKLSPKASATLSRRCLQGMIHDFWNIKGKNLNAEITALKDKIPTDLWTSIDALRQLGNIGAHMEKDTSIIVDIDPNEADSLVKLIELLIKEWYVDREERRQLFSNIISTNQSKQEARKKTE